MKRYVITITGDLVRYETREALGKANKDKTGVYYAYELLDRAEELELVLQEDIENQLNSELDIEAKKLEDFYSKKLISDEVSNSVFDITFYLEGEYIKVSSVLEGRTIRVAIGFIKLNYSPKFLSRGGKARIVEPKVVKRLLDSKQIMLWWEEENVTNLIKEAIKERKLKELEDYFDEKIPKDISSWKIKALDKLMMKHTKIEEEIELLKGKLEEAEKNNEDPSDFILKNKLMLSILQK